MKIIDCNCCIGYGVVNHQIVNHENFVLTEKVKEAKDAKELIEFMDFCSIEKAVVYHQTMIDVDPLYGNKKLVNEVAQHVDRLIPSWTILPSLTDDTFQVEGTLDAMKRHNIKMLRAFPTVNRYFLNRITMGDLLQEISERKIPLFLSPMYGYEYIYDVLTDFPDLNIIIYNYGPWSPDRYLFPLLKHYRNVHFEIGDYQTDGGLERMVGKFGSERILFGSNFPVNSFGGPLGVLISSQLDINQKENIAYRNIERILEEVIL